MELEFSVINTLLVEIFNDILTIEQNALTEGAFRDVSIREVHIIEHIGMYDTKNMSEVAKSLGITTGTLTVAINNLVKKGYVIREKNDTDRRVVNIKLTNKGRTLYRVHEHFHMSMVRTTIDGLSEEETAILSKSLAKLNAFLSERYLVSKGEKS